MISEHLAEIFDFDDADLVANRNGERSARQVAADASGRPIWQKFLPLAGLLGVVAFGLFIPNSTFVEALIAAAVIVVATFVLLVAIGRFTLPRVKVVTGPAEAKARALQVGSRTKRAKFRVEGLDPALFDSDTELRVYWRVNAGVGEVLSAEEVVATR